MYELVFVDEECFILYRFPAVLQFVCNMSEQKVIGEQHFCLALKVILEEKKLTYM